MQEYAETFLCQNTPLLSIVHAGAVENNTAVLILVGGPQYRVGSHRQFVQLSRFLAKHGVTSMRPDVRGMGDSCGSKINFYENAADIKAAIDALFRCEPHIKHVVLWGLCDAASMALIYGYTDPRVSGLILLNPWLENDEAKAKAMLRHYYLKRLFNRGFWKKLLSKQVDLSRSFREVKQFEQTKRESTPDNAKGYQQAMLIGLKKFTGHVTIILSGNDITAQSFEQTLKRDKQWKNYVANKAIVHRLAKADHTFSNSVWKSVVEKWTLKAMDSLNRK